MSGSKLRLETDVTFPNQTVQSKAGQVAGLDQMEVKSPFFGLMLSYCVIVFHFNL